MWDDILVSTYPVPSVLEGKSRQYLCNDLNKIRDFILRIWVHSVYSSFVPYLKTEWTTGPHYAPEIGRASCGRQCSRRHPPQSPCCARNITESHIITAERLLPPSFFALARNTRRPIWRICSQRSWVSL